MSNGTHWRAAARVRSKNGWGIAQLLERRSDENTMEDAYSALVNAETLDVVIIIPSENPRKVVLIDSEGNKSIYESENSSEIKRIFEGLTNDSQIPEEWRKRR